MDKYNVKGEMLFVHSLNDGLVIKKRDYEEDVEKTIYRLISGKKFASFVDSGCITDSDGSIVNIFVDGYDSNLGFCHKGLAQGGFLVAKDTFRNLCWNHKVEVNWARANK